MVDSDRWESLPLEDKIVQQGGAMGSTKYLRARLSRFQLWLSPGVVVQHQALDALSVAITSKKVNWIFGC